MKPPKITEFVNVKKFPYVMPEDMTIDTPFGKIFIPRGRLSDGASGVPDLDKKAFFTHDETMKYPYTADGQPLAKWQIDFNYGWLLFHAADNTRKKGRGRWGSFCQSVKRKYRKGAAIWRPLGMTFAPFIRGKSMAIWNDYRRSEKKLGTAEYRKWLNKKYMLPRLDSWNIPTFATKDITPLA